MDVVTLEKLFLVELYLAVYLAEIDLSSPYAEGPSTWESHLLNIWRMEKKSFLFNLKNLYKSLKLGKNNHLV